MIFPTSHKSHAPVGSNPQRALPLTYLNGFHSHSMGWSGSYDSPGRSWVRVFISLLDYLGSPAFHCFSVLLWVWDEPFITQLNKYIYICGLSLGDRTQWNFWEASNTLELLPKWNSYCGDNVSVASDICNLNKYFIFQEWVDETSKKANKNSTKIPLVHYYSIQRSLLFFNKKCLFLQFSYDLTWKNKVQIYKICLLIEENIYKTSLYETKDWFLLGQIYIVKSFLQWMFLYYFCTHLQLIKKSIWSQ